MADNVEIQGLEFQIVNDSTQTEQGLEALRNTLGRLRTACGSTATGLRGTAKSVRELKNALQGLNSGDVQQKITRIAGALNTLGQVSNVKISSSVANQLTAISGAIDSLKWTDGDKLTALADGLRPLSELEKSKLTTFINQLGKLPTVIEELEKADIDKFTRQMTDLAAAMKPFADEMQKVSNGFSAFPSRIQKLITTTEQYNNTVRKATTHTGLFGKALGGLKFAAVWQMARRVGSMLGTVITESNEYQENMNLFTAAMGEYAESALEYGETVSEVLGIDLSDWIRNQGVFNTLLTGFGDTADRAALMSKNLTQLGYDLSSFFNISVEDSMQKLQSGISGELEPLRRLGYDLSQARLEAVALSLGIDKSVSSMTQAEKAELRYYAIMTQVTTAQGDLARTLEAPANQLRILKAQVEMAGRAIGNIFIPALNAILPYGIAVVQIIREIANAIASLFGFQMTEVDYSGITSAGVGAGELADNLDDAVGAAKELKRYVAGFDELNIMPSNDATSSGAGAGVGGGSGFEFALPEYNFLDNAVSTRIDEIRTKMEPFVTWIKDNMDGILETVEAIGTAMLLWKVADGILGFFNTVKGLKGKSLLYSITFTITDLGLFLDGWDKIKEAIDDILDNGPNLTNVTQLISGFAEGLGIAFLPLGNVKLAGASLVISGLSGIVSSISDMVNNGVNFDNATLLVRNLGIFLSGVGLLTNNPALTGGGLALTGITLIVRNLADVIEAFRTGDWSGVDKVEVAAGILLTVGGFLVAIGKFKSILDASGGATNITGASTATQEIATAVGGSSGGGLNGTLKTLAQNLGWGILIITEVAATALIITGAIALLGLELEQVGAAWQPVIDNGGTVAADMGIGAGILVAVGLAAAGLGAATKGSGGTIALDIAIGTAVLVELGVAAAVFIAEVWGIGKGLDEIGQAWQPVLDNGETIATDIELGTALLVGIGVVTAALGGATVASAGLLPLAIGLGTALLVELAVSFVAFTESLVAVADELNNNLAPALRQLNPNLPQLKDDMSDFTDLMVALSEEISDYTGSMGSITWSSIVSGFQKLFAGNPIKSLADDVNTVRDDTSKLNEKLVLANPELETAVQMMTSYVDLMGQLQLLTQQGNDASTLSLDMFTNMETVGENLVTGFVAGIDNNLNKVTEAVGDFSTEVQNGWETMWTGVGNIFTVQWNRILTQLETGMNNAIDATNDVIRELGKLSSVTGVTYRRLSKITVQKIACMANGGFVDQGQLFIAREAGAEMVGQIGHRTAVANNDQIVDGISMANEEVVNAVLAMGGMIVKAIEDKDTSVSFDTDRAVRHLYPGLKRYDELQGKSLISG